MKMVQHYLANYKLTFFINGTVVCLQRNISRPKQYV